MHLSPHWGPEDPSGVQSSLYVHLSLCISLYLVGSIYLYLPLYVQLYASSFGNQSVRPVIARSACSRRPRIPQNNMYSSTLWNVCIFINFMCGGPALKWIYPHTGSQRTPVGSIQDYVSVSPSVYVSGYLPGRLRSFLAIKTRRPQLCAAHVAGGHGFISPEWWYNMFVQTSVCLVVCRFLQFWYFYSIVLIPDMITITITITITGVEVQRCNAFFPSGFQSSLFVYLYLFLTVGLYSLVFGKYLRVL